MATLSTDGGTPIPIDPVRRQTGDYSSAVTAPIAAHDIVMAAADLADVEDATRALVEFDAHARTALVGDGGDRGVAIGPMSAILLRTESASSSQIEQLTTSAKQLAQADLDETNGANAETVLGNVRAMEAALRLADELSIDSVLAMHRELLRHQYLLADEAGTFRTEQVWIGPGEAGPRTAQFVPPHHSRVADGLADVVAFAQRDDLPVLVQVAIAHAQFEIIHPFVDGNGRTGRALAQSMIRNKALLVSATVPISAGLLVDTERYFTALDEFRAGDAGPIARRFAGAARIAATTGTRLVDDLVGVFTDSWERLQGIRAHATARRLIPHFIAQPVVNAKHVQTALGVGEMATLRALDTLSDRGVLRERTGRSRGRVWEHPGVIGVLDEYAETIRRMGRGAGR